MRSLIRPPRRPVRSRRRSRHACPSLRPCYDPRLFLARVPATGAPTRLSSGHGRGATSRRDGGAGEAPTGGRLARPGRTARPRETDRDDTASVGLHRCRLSWTKIL